MKKLSDVCDLITDGTHQTPIYCESGGYPFLSSKDVVGEKINWNSLKYIPYSLHKDLYKRLQPQINDILLAKNGTTGIAAIVDREEVFDIYVSLALLRPNKNIYPKYLLYVINSPTTKRQFKSGLKGIGVPNLHLNVIRNTKIIVPSYEKQIFISKIFDNIIQLIENRQQQLNLLNELIESRFIEMFGDPVTNPMGWEMKKLDDISDVGSSKRVFVEELKNTGIPFFRGTEIGLLAEGQNIKPEFYITEQHYNELCKISGKPQYGDLLMSSICSDGRIWLVKDDFSFYFKDGRVLWIHNIVKSVNNLFLKYVLKEKFISDYEHIASGTTFKELKIFILKQLTLPCPPIELQNKFATFVEQTEKTKSTIKKSLDELNLLKDSLMQKYFG